MSSSSHQKTNGARLIRLVVDVGTETMRKYFDSIHPPETLTDVLYVNYDTLRRNIPRYQMRTLFPPTGVLPAMPSTSKNYDITLLFSLLRNICGLHPPASIHGRPSWDAKPSSADLSPEADLARVKYYRNKAIAHMRETGVCDDEFVIYWSVISGALVKLGANANEIMNLMVSPLDEDHYLNLMTETREDTRLIKTGILFILAIFVIFAFFAVISIILLTLFLSGERARSPKTPDVNYSYPQNFSIPDFVGREWVFRQIELKTSNTRGVLLVADPGWGKSAIMKHLISSSSSSVVIHDNIIGNHICKFNDKVVM